MLGQQSNRSFEQMAGEPPPSLAAEFIDFLKDNKKWWLLPILLVMGSIGLLAWFSATGAAPFLYTFW